MSKFVEGFKACCRPFIRFCIRTYCKIVYRVSILGKENIPADGSLIFCGNHRTYLDPPLIVVTAGRHMSFMAKEELRKNPLFAFLGFVFDGIYVKRDAKDLSALKTALKVLKDGGCIGLFPEGTRNGLEKNNGEVKNGAVYMALKTGAKIVPVGISGPAKPFTKNYIVYGEPIDYSSYDKKIDKDMENQLSKEMMDKIIELTKID